MGKFNEYTQKATPEDADTLMIYDAVAKSNKLSPFSGIWNWIVNKLTNAVISNLATNNKTVIGALNELSSNSLLGNVTVLNSAFDYNSLTKTGLYYLDGAQPTESANRPNTGNTNCFLLILAKSNVRCFQIVFPGNDNQIYYRNTVTDSSEWHSWKIL